MDILAKSFSKSLKNKLLTDIYGGFNTIDQDFLQNFCDRIGTELVDFINVINEEHQKEIKSLKEQNKNLETKLSSFHEGVKKLSEAIKL